MRVLANVRRWVLLLGLSGASAACAARGDVTGGEPAAGGAGGVAGAGAAAGTDGGAGRGASGGSAGVAGAWGGGGSSSGAGGATGGGPVGGAGAGSGAGGAAGGGTAGSGGAGTSGNGASGAGASGGAAGSAGSPGGGAGGTHDRDAHFRDWPQGAEPSAIAERAGRVFEARDLAGSKHYKEACAWYGALSVAALAGDQRRLDVLIAKYEPYVGTWQSLLASKGHVDENVFGIVPLELALHTGDARHRSDGLALADHQVTNIAAHKRFAIDDMFMITALQVQAYRVSQNRVYLDLAAATMVEYLDALQQRDSDWLFFHHRDFRHRWARGNGWFAAGMAELIQELPEDHEHYAAIETGFERMMSSLLTYQIPEGDPGAGLWKQIVNSPDPRNWPETSGSAMFTYALVTGVRSGWLAAGEYGPAARAAWLALVGQLTPAGELQNVSDWAYKPESHPDSGNKYTGDEENYYFDRPKLTGDNHGQAPLLWSAKALMR